ncbi:MAG TPA: PPOX class F420-dependent oxidoreductase [Actinomycetota bacterium]|nr:PPOX class F420-dependent oxidoreductase [Actinomycetota bacterium]
MLSERDRRIIDAPNFASVATLMPDGSPQVSTIWIDRDGDDILFNTAEGRVKAENLRRDGRVAISVFDQGDHDEQVIVRGRVVDLTTEGADAHIDFLAEKYLGAETYPFRDPSEQRVIVRVRPEHVSEG